MAPLLKINSVLALPLFGQGQSALRAVPHRRLEDEYGTVLPPAGSFASTLFYGYGSLSAVADGAVDSVFPPAALLVCACSVEVSLRM